MSAFSDAGTSLFTGRKVSQYASPRATGFGQAGRRALTSIGRAHARFIDDASNHGTGDALEMAESRASPSDARPAMALIMPSVDASAV